MGCRTYLSPDQSAARSTRRIPRGGASVTPSSLAPSLLLPQGKFRQLDYFAEKDENRPKVPVHAGVK